MNHIQSQNFSTFISEYNIFIIQEVRQTKVEDIHQHLLFDIRRSAYLWIKVLRAHVENEIKSMAYIQHMLRMKAKSIDPGGIFFFVDSHENVECWLNKRFFLKSKDVDKTKVGV